MEQQSAGSGHGGVLEPPVFILSCARSGSTLLRYVVDTHPEVCCPVELNLGALCAHLRVAVGGTLGEALDDDADEREKEQAVLAEVRQIVSGLMGSYATARHRRLWCEKSPSNVRYRELLHEVFPDARFICLYRNCMDVVYSLIEFSRLSFFDDLFHYVQKNPRNLIEAMIDYWVGQTTRLLAFERQNSAKCLRVKYETLVLYPRQTLESLTAFLRVDEDPGLLDKIFSMPHHLDGGGDRKIRVTDKIHKSSIGRGSSVPLKHISDDTRRTMNRLLSELEYPPVGTDWNLAPSPYLAADSTTEESETTIRVEDGLRSSTRHSYD